MGSMGGTKASRWWLQSGEGSRGLMRRVDFWVQVQLPAQQSPLSERRNRVGACLSNQQPLSRKRQEKNGYWGSLTAYGRSSRAGERIARGQTSCVVEEAVWWSQAKDIQGLEMDGASAHQQSPELATRVASRVAWLLRV